MKGMRGRVKSVYDYGRLHHCSDRASKSRLGSAEEHLSVARRKEGARNIPERRSVSNYAYDILLSAMLRAGRAHMSF